MKKTGFFHRALIAAFLVIAIASVIGSAAAYAQQSATTEVKQTPTVDEQKPAAGKEATPAIVWHKLGAAIGFGMIVIGAGLGIGKLASAAAEGISRQPAAADQISSAVNLPLFLLEGVAVLAEVFTLLIALKY
jgi:F-type H+-transporting ATPase subunit c